MAPGKFLARREILDSLVPVAKRLNEMWGDDYGLTAALRATPWFCTCVYHGRPHGENGEPAGSLYKRTPGCPEHDPENTNDGNQQMTVSKPIGTPCPHHGMSTTLASDGIHLRCSACGDLDFIALPANTSTEDD